MTVYLFIGPTLALQEARLALDAVYLPPARQGDVYRAARGKPEAIGLIDGYFDTVPSVWHKEILWAMREGVHVFGSASMGALRAAELAPFGMEGVGRIFEAYCHGELEDDDEVAVAHAPAELDYHAFSDAMVNIRATLAAAEEAGIICANTRTALTQIAKALFYPERTYARLLSSGAAIGLNGPELRRFEAWLPDHAIDQKRQDALSMLHVIRERIAGGLPPKRVRYHFEHTIYWNHLQETAGEFDQNAAELDGNVQLQMLLDEARLDPNLYRLARAGAAKRALGEALADRQALRVSSGQVDAAIMAFRRAHQLLDRDQVEEWLQANNLEATDLYDLMEEEARINATLYWAEPNLTARVVDQLKLTGAYANLAARAGDKQRELEQAGLANPTFADSGLTREGLIHWYFQVHCGANIPLDIREYASEAGFRDEYFFIRALLREFCYVKLQNAGEKAHTPITEDDR
ncbi:MAG: TfuA-like protein [Anaerolineae bacterium]